MALPPNFDKAMHEEMDTYDCKVKSRRTVLKIYAGALGIGAIAATGFFAYEAKKMEEVKKLYRMQENIEATLANDKYQVMASNIIPDIKKDWPIVHVEWRGKDGKSIGKMFVYRERQKVVFYDFSKPEIFGSKEIVPTSPEFVENIGQPQDIGDRIRKILGE